MIARLFAKYQSIGLITSSLLVGAIQAEDAGRFPGLAVLSPQAWNDTDDATLVDTVHPQDPAYVI